MEQKGNFLLLDRDEFQNWLDKQIVHRKITISQVHHTWLPRYSSFKGNNHFQLLESMRSSHIGRGFTDIAQQFTTFPDGKIGVSLKRTLDMAPAGIKGLNSTAICIENLLNGDKGGDTLNLEHQKTILHLYACLAIKFNIPVDTSHVVYHHWMSASGKPAFNFVTGASTGLLPAKSCPGDEWWFGDGNMVADANRGFIPALYKTVQSLKNGNTNINNNSKDDQQMTPQEQKAFQDLTNLVSTLTEKIESLTNSKNVLKETNMNQDQYLKNLDDKMTSMESSISNLLKLNLMDCPEWAKDAYNYYSNVITDPKGSYDFWRTLTIQYRDEMNKKENK